MTSILSVLSSPFRWLARVRADRHQLHQLRLDLETAQNGLQALQKGIEDGTVDPGELFPILRLDEPTRS